MFSGDKKDGSADGKQVSCVVVGAGNRGFGYAFYAVAFPREFKVSQICVCS